MPGDRPNPTELLDECQVMLVIPQDERSVQHGDAFYEAVASLAAALAARDREVARLREALERIASDERRAVPAGLLQSVARAALSPEVETPEPAGEPTP